MYYFNAHYTNMDNEMHRIYTISFDGQFFNNEKECYMYAMGMAYDNMTEYESLDYVEFIAC